MMQQGFGMQPQMMQGGPMGQMPMGQMQAPPGTMLPPPQAVTNQQQPGQAGGKKPKRRVLTSLALQVFIYFGAWWDVFYYVLNILVFVYKGGSEAERRDCLGRLAPWPAACTAEHGTDAPMFMAQVSTSPTPSATLTWSSAFHGSGYCWRSPDSSSVSRKGLSGRSHGVLYCLCTWSSSPCLAHT